MKKLIATIGIVASLGVGAFALNSVMPASAGTLGVDAATACATRTTPKDVLDQLVTDGTITSDQESKIIDALKSAREANRANHPNGRGGAAGLRLRAIQGAAQVAADKIGVSVEDLKAAVQGGQSVADVATAHNVNPADVEQAIVDAATAKIDQAVTNGRLTDQQASTLKTRLPDLANKFVNHKGQGC